MLAGLLALAIAAVTPSVAEAKPEPGVKSRGFRLFAKSTGALTINRVYCGLTSRGQICVDSLNSSTIPGGFWPKGTADQYIFQSGVQVAGIIGADGGDWAGDTTGAFYVDTKGTTEHGAEVEPVFNTTDPNDFNAWPTAGMVPLGDASADLFHPLLQTDPSKPDGRRRSASQGDIWTLMWDGNPALTAGRPHPLGILVETRGMGWNFPAGNEDIVYFIFTFYNITTRDPLAYSAYRPEMQTILMEKAQDFYELNAANSGYLTPEAGYTINEFYAAVDSDMDVGDAGIDYASVNLPFALGYTYQSDFAQPDGWDFPANIFSPPFFPGVGFVGVKYLKSPTGLGEVQLFSNTVNTSAPFRPIFTDAGNTTQLWRYLSGNIDTDAGDEACNNGDQTITKICWVNNTAPADVRFFQSSTGLTLAPGASGSIVVAYVHAAPVSNPAVCSPPCSFGGAGLKPGDPVKLSDVGELTAGNVNGIDRMTGFLDYSDENGNGIAEPLVDLDLDGVRETREYTVVPGSLLGKSYTAQAVFDAKFLLPFAPDSPEFFLIPGDNNVTVLWQPTASETGGDPFFSIASDVLNPLYDPNYRQFDVEGYRIYRGRVDTPTSMTLIAQFDYAGTFMSDYAGQLNPTLQCAPELGVEGDCPIDYDPVAPGVPRTAHVDVPLVGRLIQVKLNERAELASGNIILLTSDTAMTGNAAGYPLLDDTGVPFVFVDNDVRNNFRYFYAVTAFDVNSWQSGPSVLESFRATKSTTPVRPASNYVNTATFTSGIYGRDVALDFTSSVTIDPTTGRFGGIMPAADAWTLGFTDFVKQVISEPGNFAVHLDSMTLGSSGEDDEGTGVDIPIVYYLSAINGPDITPLTLSIHQDYFDGEASSNATFDAVAIDNDLASVYGGSSDYVLKGEIAMTQVGNYYAAAYGRGCVNGAPGFDVGGGCDRNGPRWFDGPSPANNETKVDPIFGNTNNFTTGWVDTLAPNNTGWNNGGELTGVSVIHQPYSYQTMGNQWRNVEGVIGSSRRQADFNVYWGAGGKVDSVIDATHNVPVPFDSTLYRGGWGILNQAGAPTAGAAGTATASFDARAELSLTDLGCVEPFRSYGAPQSSTRMRCGTATLGDGPLYVLTQTAVPGTIVHFSGTPADARTRAPAAEAGFVMLIGGNMFMFQLTGGALPATGAVWSLRSYVGAITGGNGWDGDDGPYAYFPVPRPFNAVGAEVRVNYDVVNQVNTATGKDLKQVHTVPDPYYVTNEFETTTDSKIIKFVNLPADAIIRIYSSSGVLVALLEHHSDQNGGALDWDVRNRNAQFVASGVYFYHVESGDATRIGKMTIVNFAQ
jgi:hypothetical protein